MLKYDIEINFELSNDVEKKVNQHLRILIDNFIKDNNITSLYKIVFTDDWDKELGDFQKKYSLPIEYTDTKYGSASAKTLKVKIGEETKCVIFYRKEVLLSMVQQEEFGIIHLFHELSHIYYFEKAGTNLDSLKKKYNMNQDFMESSKSFGLVMWEEYFVSRYLCPYLFGSTDCYIGILGEQYKIIKKDLEKAINDYRYSANIDELYNLAKQQVTLLSTYMAYSCGMVRGISDKSTSLYGEIVEIIKKTTGLTAIWEQMYKIYDEIYSEFPELDNIDIKLFELNKMFIKIYNHFGIYPKKLKDGRLYIDVPF